MDRNQTSDLRVPNFEEPDMNDFCFNMCPNVTKSGGGFAYIIDSNKENRRW